MLRSMKDLEDYAIPRPNGIIGHVKDFYFDEEGGHPLSRRRTAAGFRVERC